jgi:predicted metal-dependent phosphoesterase TrpH
MIDLHTHTDESDGTFSPAALVAAANAKGLEALAITDHDTFAGYLQAVPIASAVDLDLVCGIELATKFHGRSTHLLAYFLNGGPDEKFQRWVLDLQHSRQVRNQNLIEKLKDRGVSLSLEDLQRHGRKLVGRPHFAAVLVEKGYATSLQDAFDKYLDESAASFVSRDEPAFSEAVERVVGSGGFPSLAHPGRVSRDPAIIETYLREMRDVGLKAMEVYHSDHSREDTEFYASLAQRLFLAPTGGSDFHGTAKPNVMLGTGRNHNVNVPKSVLSHLREIA